MTTEVDEPSPEQKFSRILCVHFKDIPCFFSCPIYNGQMFGEDKNLKDPGQSRLGGVYGAGSQNVSVMLSYNKTHKLITALYMVTDILDKDEPLRNKLRTLGVEILSDLSAQAGTSSTSKRHFDMKNIDQVLSFLDIAFTMNMISEMNKNILLNEFTHLRNSLIVPQDNPVWLEEFLKESTHLPMGVGANEKLSPKGHLKRHTRLGVQRGSTLLKALSDRMGLDSKTNVLGLASHSHSSRARDFYLLKKQRRDNIINTIKKNGGSATIKDIKLKISSGIQRPSTGEAEALTLTLSEKTLQRELMSMTKDGVLNKTGEKRWSRYFVK